MILGIVFGVLLLSGLIVAVMVAITYNGLVSIRQRVKNAWSQIDVQLKRRHDLIPNLVEVAKGYMQHEQDTLEKVIKARNMAVAANGVKETNEAENFLSGTLKSLFSVVENYPDLKADQQMQKLHEELTSTENKITFARQHFNDEAMNLNTQIETFPVNIVAGIFNFKKEDFFQVETEEERQAPEVKF